MYLAYFLLVPMLLVSQQCALAVNTRQQQDANEKAIGKQVGISVGQNAYLSYNKNVKEMEYHSQGAAAANERIKELDRRKDQLAAKQPKLHRYDLRESKDLLKLWRRTRYLRRAKHKLVEKRWDQNQKMQRHKSAWSEASDAAGGHFRVNRLLHATMPNDVKAAQNNPKKALQLVAENAGKRFGPRLEKAQAYAKYYDHTINQLNKLHDQYNFHNSDATGKSGSPIENYHTMLHKEYERVHGLGRKAANEARQHLWTNRILHLTVKGVDPIKLPELMFKSLTKGGRTRPWQDWSDTVQEKQPP